MAFSATSTYLISQYNGKIDLSEILFEKENAQLSVALAKSYKRVITNHPKAGKILKTNVLKQEKLCEKKAASDVITKQELSEFSGERSTQLDWPNRQNCTDRGDQNPTRGSPNACLLQKHPLVF